MKKSEFIIAIIQDPNKREKLYGALDKRYAMWGDAFIVDANGTMRPNPHWWKIRKLYLKSALIEIQTYCKGWLDGQSK